MMMELRRKLLLGMFVAATGSAAHAEPIEFDCDTPGGNYSEITFRQGGTAHRVRAEITPIKLRPSGRWLPAATITVQSQDEQRSAGIQLVNSSGKNLGVVVMADEGGQTKKVEAGQIRAKEGLPFDLYLPSTGSSFVEVLGKRVTLGINVGPNAKVSITCSSGQFRFKDLDWDWQPQL